MSQNTGHAINAGNFEQLISVLVSFGISYNPTAVGLKLVGMNSKLVAANGVVADVAAKLATQDSVDADREYLFDGLPAETAQREYLHELGTMRSLCMKLLESKRLVA